MAGSRQNETYQPKTVIWRESDYKVHLGQVLGVLDYDNNFDNTFQKWKLMIQFIEDVMEAIKQEIIPLKAMEKLDLMPNAVAISKMNKIWHGDTFLGVVRNHESTKVLFREFFYDKPNNYYELKDESNKVIDTFKREVIQSPKLKDLIPVGEIDSDNWGIRVKESMPLKYAWEGANYATIINDGKFVHHLSDGLLPKFDARDMKSMIKKTQIIHRPVYNTWMDILPRFFNKNYYIFAGNVQKIMKWMEDEDTDVSDLIDAGDATKSESTESTENNQ